MAHRINCTKVELVDAILAALDDAPQDIDGTTLAWDVVNRLTAEPQTEEEITGFPSETKETPDELDPLCR